MGFFTCVRVAHNPKVVSSNLAPATIHMYAYFKVTIAVGVGVYFYHRLAHLLGVSIQTLHGIPKQLYQLFHADGVLFLATLDDILQL